MLIIGTVTDQKTIKISDSAHAMAHRLSERLNISKAQLIDFLLQRADEEDKNNELKVGILPRRKK